jgi:hypothetical protein
MRWWTPKWRIRESGMMIWRLLLNPHIHKPTVIAAERANVVRSAHIDLWEKERAAKCADGNLKYMRLELEKLKVNDDTSAADTMKMRAKYPDTME